MRVVVSARITQSSDDAGAAASLLRAYHGQPMRLPEVYAPDPMLLRYHRDTVFAA